MKNVFKKVIASAATVVFLLPAMAFAAPLPGTGLGQAQTDLGVVQGQLSGGKTALPVLIGNLINVVLGVMGIVFVVLIVYAGILYMQAGTDPKKAETAKKVIINAVIGLVITVSAYAISTFVIGQIITAAT